MKLFLEFEGLSKVTIHIEVLELLSFLALLTELLEPLLVGLQLYGELALDIVENAL